MQQNFPNHLLLPDDLDESAYQKVCFDNFIEVQEGFTFDLGHMTAEVIELPGHTRGSIGLLCKERKLFLVSDAINGGVWMFLPESTGLSIYQNTLEKADKLDFEYMLQGHGNKLILREKMKDYLAVAKNLDFENGKAGEPSDFAPGVIPVTCVEKGKEVEKTLEKGYATIVISEEKLHL